jgi:plastocyanin
MISVTVYSNLFTFKKINMKRIISVCVVSAAVLLACKKTGSTVNDTTLTASTTEAAVGQTVTLQVTTSKNAVSWTANPSASALIQNEISVQKTNTVSFTQPGTYIIGVRARNIAFDSAHHNNLDSCWHHGGGDEGHCTKGLDSASVTIKVK